MLRASRVSAIDQGVGLVELLVALVIASIVIGATSFLLLSELRNTARFEEANKAEENMARLISLVNTEAAEGYELYSGVSVDAACVPPNPATSESVIAVKLREISSSSGTPVLLSGELGEDASIYYYNVSGVGIYRCGPALFPFGSTYNESRDGRLDYSSCCSAQLVGPGMNLTVASGAPVGSSESRLAYSVSIMGKNYSRSSSAASGGRHLASPTWPP